MRPTAPLAHARTCFRSFTVGASSQVGRSHEGPGSMRRGSPKGSRSVTTCRERELTDSPRIAVIGLDCVPPQLMFRDFAAETPEHQRAHEARDVGRSGEHHPADHRAGLGLRDDGQDAGSARHLRVPQPQGHLVRGTVDRDGRRRQGARRLGQPRGEGDAITPDRRAPVVPPPKEFPGWRVGCFLTPPSSKSWAYPAELETEIVDELGEGLDYIFDISDFRRVGYDVARAGLPDDGATLPGRTQAGDREAVGLLHAVRDRARPLHHVFWQHWDPPTRSTSRATSTRRPSRTTTGSWTSRSAPAGRPARRRDHDRDERSRRPADDGRLLLQRLADPRGVPRPSRRTRRTDSDQGRRDRLEPDRSRGGTAATTVGCS